MGRDLKKMLLHNLTMILTTAVLYKTFYLQKSIKILNLLRCILSLRYLTTTRLKFSRHVVTKWRIKCFVEIFVSIDSCMYCHS